MEHFHVESDASASPSCRPTAGILGNSVFLIKHLQRGSPCVGAGSSPASDQHLERRWRGQGCRP